MNNQYLQIFNRPIITEGPVLYDNSLRANNRIRLKKKILNAFGDISEIKSLFYRTELYPDFEQLQKRIDELKREKKTIPVLLFLFR